MDKNWRQLTRSEFVWEREALAYVKEQLPDHEPYRAWANFEFIAQDGSINEIDLMLLTPKGLYLVEIKSHPGEISGDSGTWIWHKPDGSRKLFDNPRILTDRKAKKLASLLKLQPSARAEGIPFLSSLVFLSAENVINSLEGHARAKVYTRKDFIKEITEIDVDWRWPRLDKSRAKTVARAMEEAGIKESVRSRRVGLYVLGELLDEADHYQEWLAYHEELNVKRRVRIYLTYGKPPADAERLQRAARHEFKMLEGIEHPGILRAKDYQQHEHDPALVYDYDQSFLRLDHLLLELGNSHLHLQDAFKVLKLIAETVRYAHRHKLCHRVLSPQSIYIRIDELEGYAIKIANWFMAERTYETETQQLSIISHMSQLVQEEAGPYVALECHSQSDTDGVLLDIFSLGAIAYHLFTGKKPADNDIELQDKLARTNGLLITNELNGAGTELQYLIQYATHPNPDNRIGSMDEFFDHLLKVEEELARPETFRSSNPIEARKGDVLEGGIEIIQELGKGASSKAFLIKHHGVERVLKLALEPAQNKRLRCEGATLAKLRHSAVIAHYDTVELAGHTGLIIHYAADGTLAKRLREYGAVQLELLERFGDDLLGALCHLEDQGINHRDIKPENIGLIMQGKQLHLVLFDFSLSNTSVDNYSAGTAAYMDPFIRDPGRRRWDDHAERFACALTLYEMAAGALPGWTSSKGLPNLIEGELEVERRVFDPVVRDAMAEFFQKALARDIGQRFASAGEMLRDWKMIFHLVSKQTSHPTGKKQKTCPIAEAQLTTQVGLLDLSVQALDTLSRLNINKVSELIRLPRNELVRMAGVGTNTRKELSDAIGNLQERLGAEVKIEALVKGEGSALASVDRLFRFVMPKVTKATDPARQRFLNEFLGRLDSEAPRGVRTIHWPNLVHLSGEANLDTSDARIIHEKLMTKWGKTQAITELRNDIEKFLDEHGGVMTAIELSEVILLRRGSVQDSPLRERWSQAVCRAAVETELSKQNPRWILRRHGNRIIIADNREELGEELADYAAALGEIADECAERVPLLSPVQALRKVSMVVAPSSFTGMSNQRLLSLAAASSQKSALSSRAEFYPKEMKADRTLELAQGALLGSKALSVEEVQTRIHGRYPEAEPLPGRPQLDTLVQGLEIGFQWDSQFIRPDGKKGAYCLPQAGLTSLSSKSRTATEHSQLGDVDTTTLEEVKRLEQEIATAIETSRFLALTVKPQLMVTARDKLCKDYPLKHISFDELLFHHLQELFNGMPKAPRWDVVLKADAAQKNSVDWGRLQMLVSKVLPAMANEIKSAGQPVLLTEPGLIARYDLVNSWLNELRQHLLNADSVSREVHGMILLVAADAQRTAAVIDGTIIPRGTGAAEFARIASVWLEASNDSIQQQA
ncbi:BREX system serine/threonine kinase PglW [Endozoicomonas sp. 4G]|uniref:BREX system serine/threonine kinase PglW n=1 Tax=Endozoicomonas sp. 4G TaxID=2872754 RepID=UPI002078A367|nr:BREX system serine/threonine kinase PglW [Endozoicomonas sp. 4G]